MFFTNFFTVALVFTASASALPQIKRQQFSCPGFQDGLKFLQSRQLSVPLQTPATPTDAASCKDAMDKLNDAATQNGLDTQGPFPLSTDGSGDSTSTTGTQGQQPPSPSQTLPMPSGVLQPSSTPGAMQPTQNIQTNQFSQSGTSNPDDDIAWGHCVLAWLEMGRPGKCAKPTTVDECRKCIFSSSDSSSTQ